LCQYFNLQPIINGAKTSGDNIPNKLFIVNQGAHWERAILSLPIPTMAPKFQDKHFYQSYLSHRAGSRYFLQHIKKIGEIYFSAQYLEPSSSPKDLETAKTHPLYKVIANQDIKSYVAKNKPSDIEAMKLIELALTCYTSDQFIEWFKLIKDIDIIACQYNKILLAAVVQDKNNIVIKLLAGFTKEFTPANCMLALLHATEKNDSYIAHKILSHPGFYEKSITKNFIGYVKSFVYEPLNTFDKYGIPAIYYAIKHQNVGLVKVLLEKGACINYQLDINQLKILDISTKGASRLTSMPSEETFGFDLSLEIGNPETAVLLTKKLIFTRREYYNRNSNSSGDKLVHLCAKNGKMELVEKIPCSWDDFKPISELTDNNALGKNCLHLTTELNDIDGMIYCLSYDPRLLSSIDEEGNTPLHLAVLNGHIEAVKLLADKYHDKYHGKYQGKYKILDINEKNLKDFSPLMLANKSTKNKEIIKYLKNNGAIDKFQNLVDSITEAFIRRDPDFTPILLQDAKSTALFDENRDTLLHYACSVF
jgi:ankyrin repeat protein